MTDAQIAALDESSRNTILQIVSLACCLRGLSRRRWNRRLQSREPVRKLSMTLTCVLCQRQQAQRAMGR